MTPEATALLTRIDVFVGKLRARQAEIASEAAEGFLEFSRLDELPQLRVALGEVEAFVSKIDERLRDVWDADIDPKIEELDEDGVNDRAHQMKEVARSELELDWEAFKSGVIVGVLTRATAEMTQAAMATSPCVGCGAPVGRQQPGRAESVTCPHCGVVNQLLLTPALVDWFHSAPRGFAEHDAMPFRHQIERLKVQNLEEESPTYLREYEQLQRQYWETYYRRHAQVCNEPFDPSAVEAQMKLFRETVLGGRD